MTIVDDAGLLRRTFNSHETMRFSSRVREVLGQATETTAEWAADNAREDARTTFLTRTANGVDSPIEQLFFAAFLPYQVITNDYRIRQQVKIGRYRADFVVSFYWHKDRPPLEVVVECDGHDFHEKTKEQAERDKKRDRFLTSSGYTVMRFTGRELHRDPSACVEEVIDYTQNVMYETQMAESGFRIGRSAPDA